MPVISRPSPVILPLFFSIPGYGKSTDVTQTANFSLGGPIATTWVPNLVSYMPFSNPFDYPINRVVWANGSTITTSNVDFGIYTPDGKKIYSTGTTVQAGPSIAQYVTPSPTFILPKGSYYAGWTCDNTTNRACCFQGSVMAGIMYGMLQESTVSFGLPATMTPVRWAQVFGYCAVGFTRTTTGF